MKNKLNGKLGELAARWYMRLHGYRIVCRNQVIGRGTTAGELDFVACKGKVLVFVEVKERNKIELAMAAISKMAATAAAASKIFFLRGIVL